MSTTQTRYDDPQFSGRLEFTSTGSMQISQIQLPDEGVYRCEPASFNMVGTETTIQETELTIYGEHLNIFYTGYKRRSILAC